MGHRCGKQTRKPAGDIKRPFTRTCKFACCNFLLRMCENDTVYPLFARFPVSIHFRPDFPCNANVFVSIEEEVVDALTEHDFLNWLDKCFVWETRDVVACKEDWTDIFTFARGVCSCVYRARAFCVTLTTKPQEQSFFSFFFHQQTDQKKELVRSFIVTTTTTTTTRVQRTRRKERENKRVILTIRHSSLPFCNT